MAATALEQTGLTQYGVKFFPGFTQQTAVRMSINKSDGECAMKTLKGCGSKGPGRGRNHFTRIASGRPPSKGDMDSTVRTLKAQMRATRFALESRLGRLLAHDDPVLTWMPTCALGMRARKKMCRRLIGIRRTLLHERGQGTSVRSCQERLGAEAHRSQVSWTAGTDGCHDW